MLTNTKYGTDNQTHYIGILKSKLGPDVVAAITRKVMGLDETSELPASISSEVVSTIIDELKKMQPPKVRKSAGGESTQDTLRLTGRELLALADPTKEVPVYLDDDLRVVVARLRRLHMIQGMISKTAIDKPIAVNGPNPILISTLVELLGSPSEAAKALGVTLKTLEGWGDYLPESHESRAQLVTAGAVKARLPG